MRKSSANPWNCARPNSLLTLITVLIWCLLYLKGEQITHTDWRRKTLFGGAAAKCREQDSQG